MTDAEIAALKAAAERAEPKVWRQGVDYDDGALIAPDSNDWLAYFSVSGDPPDADGARLDFVALANPATILALLARLDAAERERDEAQAALAGVEHQWALAEARAERLEKALRQIADGPWPDEVDSPEAQTVFDEQIARAALAAERGETGEGGAHGRE